MATFALSDIHGHYEIYEKVKAMLKPEDKVYFLGDACDRAPKEGDSWKCVKAIYHDPQFIYLLGNHEDMLVKACEDYLEYGTWSYDSYLLSYRNGGKDTMDSWERDQERELWVKRLRDLPTWDTYENKNGVVFVLCHAGLTPWLAEGTLDECVIPNDEALIWDREHYLEDYDIDQMDNVIVVGGHTPAHYMSADLNIDWESGAFWYCNGHKVCIDSGGFFSGEFVLLDLDTLEDIIFTLDKKS